MRKLPLKAEEILLTAMLSLTALPHRGHETTSPCDVGGAEREEPLAPRSRPLERSTAEGRPSSEIVMGEAARSGSDQSGQATLGRNCSRTC
jgi:hypothetical protein